MSRPAEGSKNFLLRLTSALRYTPPQPSPKAWPPAPVPTIFNLPLPVFLSGGNIDEMPSTLAGS
jgi:hypothetical protein